MGHSYLILQCWIAMEDCMCSILVPCSLCKRIRFWVYMHPKVCCTELLLLYYFFALLSDFQLFFSYLLSFFQDFLRQNNTGKLLWQLFGVQAASLCLFGIHEHEEIMWDAFTNAGDI